MSQLYFSHEIAQCHRVLVKSSVITFVFVIGSIFFVTLLRDIMVGFIATDQYTTSALLFLLVGLFVMSKLIFDNISLLHNASNRLNIIVIGYAIFSVFVIWLVPRLAKDYGFYSMTISLVACWGCFIISVFIHLKYVLLKP